MVKAYVGFFVVTYLRLSLWLQLKLAFFSYLLKIVVMVRAYVGFFVVTYLKWSLWSQLKLAFL